MWLIFPDFPAGLKAAIFGRGTSQVDSAMSQVCDVTKLDLTETFDAVVEKGCILVAVWRLDNDTDILGYNLGYLHILYYVRCMFWGVLYSMYTNDHYSQNSTVM